MLAHGFHKILTLFLFGSFFGAEYFEGKYVLADNFMTQTSFVIIKIISFWYEGAQCLNSWLEGQNVADVFLMNVPREKEEKCHLDLPNQTIFDFTIMIVAVVPKTTLFPSGTIDLDIFRRSSKSADGINGLRHQSTPSWPLLLFKFNHFIVQDEHTDNLFFKKSLMCFVCEVKLELLRWNFLPGYHNFSIKKASRWRASTCQWGSTRAHVTRKISPNLVWSRSVTMATAWLFPKTSE